MRDDKPIKQRYFPKNPAMQRIIDEQIDILLRNDCIEPSRSPHSAPIVLERKKSAEMRLCVDFRRCIPAAKDNAHLGASTPCQEHIDARFEEQILANSCSRVQPRVRSIYSPREGLVPLESDAVWPPLSTSHIPAGAQQRHRTGQRVCVFG
ncbi:uncharacterized protein LOC127010778 [Drosophila biarmipes]|uniref:uncharacterized protein LOC127010778 n=1 Tax=Drosophila biarmipes TaxID=125945 RepID=UPI0021CCD420|nr:uncharacterized protein LOC127010778 [Drosophila biarmipes]